jgi:hypothetical protein
MVEGVFSPVTAPCEDLDLNRAYSLWPVMQGVPMEFGGPSSGDGFIHNLFV